MAKVRKIRLDDLLVERGWADSADEAARLIRAGQVRRATDVLDKPGVALAGDAVIEVRDLHGRFVGRGGLKMEGALEAWGDLKVEDGVFADIGSSTGGFTDCLLQRGARRVYAVDSGRGQLVDRLREDERVVVMEQTNARHLSAEKWPEPIDGFVSDVSFISLRAIMPPVAALLKPGVGWAVVLVKPQFEAEARQVERGGIVRDPAVHREVLERVAGEYAPEAGLVATGLMPSPIYGAKGNREFLMRLERGGSPVSQADIEHLCLEAHE